MEKQIRFNTGKVFVTLEAIQYKENTRLLNNYLKKINLKK